MKEYSKLNNDLLQMDEQKKAYIEYYDKFGTEPYGLCIGYPYVEDITALHQECIRQGKTWEQLLHYIHPPKDAVI